MNLEFRIMDLVGRPLKRRIPTRFRGQRNATGLLLPVLPVLLALLLSGLAQSLNAAPYGLPDPLETVEWASEHVETPVQLSLHASGGSFQNLTNPVVVYVVNHAMPRVGRESDATILRDMLAEDWVIVLADFGSSEQAVAPALEHELLAVFNAIRTGELFTTAAVGLDRNSVHIVPQGYRLALGVIYWQMDKHGAHGTLDWIMQQYNRRAVSRAGVPPVEHPSQMQQPTGEPIEYALRMDVVYPSDPHSPVPVVMFQASGDPPQQWMRARPHLIGFSVRGYAIANYEHNFNPIARSDHYGFYHPYSLDPHNGVASNTAAVRCLRSHAEKWHINPDRIAVWGHSKASYGAVLLGNPNNHQLHEWSTFEGFPSGSPEPQPWPDVSSAVALSYQSAGDGTQRYRSLIGPDYVPTLTSHGDRDSFIAAEYWQEHFHHLQTMQIPHLAMVMHGIGHTFPMGFDKQHGYDRYSTVFEFFDARLRPELFPHPALLYALPLDNARDVCAEKPVTLRFANAIDTASVTASDGVRVIEVGNNRVLEGSWQVLQQNTLFRWQPAQPLTNGAAYRLEIPASVATAEGTPMKTAISRAFSAGHSQVKPLPPIDEYRRKNDLLFGIADASRPPFTGWPEAGLNVDSLPAFAIEPYNSLHYTAAFRIVSDDKSDGSGRHFLRWRQGGEGSIRIDFGQPTTVSQVVVRSGSEDGYEMLSALRLQAALDSRDNLRTIAEISDNHDAVISIEFPPVTARWFVIDGIPIDQPVRIGDVEMYARPRTIEPALNLLYSDAGNPILRNAAPTLHAIATDSSVQAVAFEINGSSMSSPVKRENNRFSIQLSEPLPESLKIQAKGTDAQGAIVQTPTETRSVVTPQIDLLTFLALPEMHRQGEWRLQSDGTLLSPTRGELFLTGEAWRDMIIEADIEVINASGNFNLIYRAIDPANYDRYEFRITRAETRFVRDGRAERIRRNFDAGVRTGQKLQLRLDLRGQVARLFMDGKEVFAFDPLDHPHGGFGFATNNAQIRIHGLRVYLKDSASAAPMLAQITPKAPPQPAPPLPDPQERQTSGIFPTGTPWFSSAADNIELRDDYLRQQTDGTTLLIAYPGVDAGKRPLSRGERIRITYHFAVEGISASNRSPWFRVGLFDSSQGQRIDRDDFNLLESAFQGYRGFIADTANLRAGSVSLHQRSNVQNNNLLATLRIFTRLTEPFSHWSGLREGSLYEGEFIYQHNSNGSYDLHHRLIDDSGREIYRISAQAIPNAPASLDCFALLLSGASINAFQLHSVEWQ